MSRDTDATAARRALIVWALVTRGGRAKQSELRPELTKPDREALIAAGSLRAETVGRALYVELTDRGWAWAGANTAARLPATGNAANIVLGQLLARLGTYMAARDVALADIILPAPAPPMEPLAERIRAAYLAETGGATGRRVRLAAIRARLPDAGHAELDAALIGLASTGAADLLPLDDPTTIGPADRAAALSIGVEARHLLWLHS
jgi:hypothetical protein